MGIFRKTIERACSLCEKTIIVKLRRPWWGWSFWKWRIISGGYYWGVPLPEDHPNYGKPEAEYWECKECYYAVDDDE